MFDVGFWELSLIFVVALIVLGPERLPRAARTMGLWVGKARQVLSSVKADIDREMQAEDLKSMMNKRGPISELDDFVKETKETIDIDGSAAPKPEKPPATASKPSSPADPTE